MKVVCSGPHREHGATSTAHGNATEPIGAQVLFGQEHVERYRETDGEVGHEWRPGVYTLLLTTTGRKSGEPYTTPLIYGEDGEDFVVVASKGGAPSHPDWYRNLEADPRSRSKSRTG